ncbi:MAG: homogentisate phytyltransferase [Cyanobacteria bacterium P01_H01_bin.15]
MSSISSNLTPVSLRQTPGRWLRSFWKFCRPHTIVGTSFSVWSLALIAALQNPVNSTWISLLPSVLLAWTACLGGNIYIVGLNQLLDIEIDRINKPQLPLAAGEFSVKQGVWLVMLTGLSGLVLGLVGGKWLLLTVAISLLLGSAYSLPPFRLKRYPLLAALCILTVRGVVVNLGLSLFFTRQFNAQEYLSPAVLILAIFVLFFSIGIALFKDVPDTEGDQRYQIATFSLLLGKRTVLKITLAILASCYLGMVVAGIWRLPGMNPLLLIGVHSILLCGLCWRARGLDLQDKSAIASFYQFIWRLFFLEYLLFPFMCGSFPY